MKNLLTQVQETLQKYRMLKPGERILVACSGGADSVALFYLLKELVPSLKIRLSLIHFDHGLRSDSPRDAEFVRRLARRFDVPFWGGKGKLKKAPKKGLSPEAQAREKRYEFFERVSRKTGIRKIALAHHQDDQAETVLMRLLQGTGLRGLQGIRLVSSWKRLTLIRPLIETSRTGIREFLRERKIGFREDSTNRSRGPLRNRVRHELLPLLEKKFNPQIRGLLCRLADTAVSESGGLDDWVRERWKACVRSRRNGTVWLDRERFLLYPGLLQFRLLDQILHSIDPRSGLDFESWKKIEAGLRKGRFRMTLPRNLDFRFTPKKLFVKRPA
jgi:tRNA(Ile)-lysidine synthase